MPSYTKLELYINGGFKSGQGRRTEPVFNPADASVIGELSPATLIDLEMALGAAETAFPGWSLMSALDRSAILRRAAELIRTRIDSIAVIMTLEQGKPVAESYAEVNHAADVIDWYAEEGKRIYGRLVPSRVPGVRMAVAQEPVGVVAAFTPWNFPALTPCRKIGGALAAGCTIILKAAEEVPGTALEIVRAFHDAGLPKGVLNLVFGDPEFISNTLIASPVIRKVSFTGSTSTGKHLSRLCADDLKRMTMELGGHAPVLVFDDVDVEAVAEASARTKYRNAGQVCISPTRFFVHEAVYGRFIDRFTQVAQGLRLGDGLMSGVDMGPLINPRRIEAMEQLVEDLRDRGATINAGGLRHGNVGWFFQPTVATGLDDTAKVMEVEPFGPIAPIVSFSDGDAVIGRANALPFGLAAYAFTGCASRMVEISARLRSGMVGINTFAVSQPETPFGGRGHSGHGSEGGTEGLTAYLDTKLIAAA